MTWSLTLKCNWATTLRLSDIIVLDKIKRILYFMSLRYKLEEPEDFKLSSFSTLCVCNELHIYDSQVLRQHGNHSYKRRCFKLTLTTVIPKQLLEGD
jgi:hypothetical protein